MRAIRIILTVTVGAAVGASLFVAAGYLGHFLGGLVGTASPTGPEPWILWLGAVRGAVCGGIGGGIFGSVEPWRRRP